MAVDDALAAEPRLFDDVHFAVVLGDGIDESSAQEISRELQDHGATHYDLSSAQLPQITHLIANSPNFPAYEDACDAFIHVVKPSWVKASIFRKRPANLRQYRPDPRLVLSDMVVVIAEDIPQGDKDAIIGGLQAMGGQFSSIMTKLVTHVIALTMDNSQCRIIVEKNLSCKAVLPHWFDQCLILGKKIDPAPYTLPNPPILNEDDLLSDLKDKSRFNDNVADLKSAMHLEPVARPPDSPSKNRKELAVFRHKKMKLADDLDLKPHLRQALVDVITRGGGNVVAELDDADTLICRYRHSLDFKEALDSGKDIGSLNWLYHLINTNKWSAPTRKLLHFPSPKAPLPGFDKYRISVSNYAGEARIYLESLIKAAGGSYTKTMTQNNTHLITAHGISEKVDAAREWKIETVNHLWLEESYAQCKGQALTNARYTTFPSRTNLGEIIGQTQLDRKVLEHVYLPHRASAEPAETSTKTPARSRSAAVVTPAANDKENMTPSSRGAKDRAISKLHLMAPDIAQFEKELKRRGGVIYGGRRVTDPERIPLQPSGGQKRNAAEQSEGEEDAAREMSPQSKRHKTPQQPDRRVRFVVTNGPAFNWSVSKGSALCKYGLKELQEAPMNGGFDVLVAPGIVRTPNFLAAIAAGVPIVGPKWLEDTLAGQCQLDTKGYELKDASCEEETGMQLAQSLKRAREHREHGGLMANMTVYCTQNVRRGVQTVSDMVKRNGGECVVFKSREARTDGGQGADKDMVLMTVPGDRAVWHKFQNLARESGRTAKLVTSDWLVRVVMVQDLYEWNDEWALGEDAA